MLGCESPSRCQSAAVRKVGLKDVLKVISEVSCSTSSLVSSAASSSTSSISGSSSSLAPSSSVTLPLQQTVAVCTLLMMTDDSRRSNRLVNNEVTLGKVLCVVDTARTSNYWSNSKYRKWYWKMKVVLCQYSKFRIELSSYFSIRVDSKRAQLFEIHDFKRMMSQ